MKYKEISKFPSVKKDVAFVVDKALTSKEIEVSDVYTGITIGIDKKSIAYSLTFSDNKKTLTDEEVNNLMQKVMDNVCKKFGAEVRK